MAALPLAALATFFLRLSASVDMLACLTACDVSMAVPTLLSGNIRLKTCCERAVSCAATTTSGEAARSEWRGVRPSHLRRRALLRGGFVLLALALIARGLSSDHLVKPAHRCRTDLRSRHGLAEVLLHVVLVLERVLIDARTCALARGARRVQRLATVPLLLRL